jgi:Skp family chaperone for outer membrane proteins
MRVLVDLIRSLAVVAVLLLLLFCSFAVNPGMFGWFSRDYARIADAYAPERSKLLDKRLEFDSELKDRRRDLADIEQKLTLTRARLGSGKDAELQADIDQLLDLKATEEQQVVELQKSVAQTEKDIADIDRVVDRVQNSAETIYLAVRCVALGALGAMVQTLVAFLSRRRLALLFRYGNVERAFAAMMIGALAVVATFSAFHTREVTIFNTVADASDLHPDFWRVTVLGLAVGALASWIFQAVTAGDRRFAQPDMATRRVPAPPVAVAVAAEPAAAAAAVMAQPRPAGPVAPPAASVAKVAPAPPATAEPAAAAAAAVAPPLPASGVAAPPAPAAAVPAPPAVTVAKAPPAPPAAAAPAAAAAAAAAPSLPASPVAPPAQPPLAAAALQVSPLPPAAAKAAPADGAPFAPRPPAATAVPPISAAMIAPAPTWAADLARPKPVLPIGPPATSAVPAPALPSLAPPAASVAPPGPPVRPPLPPIPELLNAKPEPLPAAPAALAGRGPPIAPTAPSLPPLPPPSTQASAATAPAKWPQPLPGTGGAPVPPAKRPA